MAPPITDPRGQVAQTAVPTRRGTEALLLGFAVLITVVAQCIVDLTITGSLRPEMAAFSAWITALWVVAHLVVRKSSYVAANSGSLGFGEPRPHSEMQL